MEVAAIEKQNLLSYYHWKQHNGQDFETLKLPDFFTDVNPFLITHQTAVNHNRESTGASSILN